MDMLLSSLGSLITGDTVLILLVVAVSVLAYIAPKTRTPIDDRIVDFLLLCLRFFATTNSRVGRAVATVADIEQKVVGGTNLAPEDAVASAKRIADEAVARVDTVVDRASSVEKSLVDTASTNDNPPSLNNHNDVKK